jgi:ABC-type antimicrobial peptide transport system permease subunit
MSLLGVCFGVGIGLLLAWLVGPLVAVSPNGSPPVPSVIVQVPGWSIAALVLGVVIVLTVVVAGVARVQRFTEPAHLLREGAQA